MKYPWPILFFLYSVDLYPGFLTSVICEGDEATEIKMLRTKVASLEAELDSRDSTVDDLRTQLIRARASDDHKERLQVRGSLQMNLAL